MAVMFLIVGTIGNLVAFDVLPQHYPEGSVTYMEIQVKGGDLK